MEQSKEINFIEKAESILNKNNSLCLPATVRNILANDINHCKEHILESQKKIENIQYLLKLIRYSSVKDFYGNQQISLDNVEDKSLQYALSSQHPTVIAASAQLLKLQSRPKRQAAKKIQVSTKNKVDKVQTKSLQNDGAENKCQEGTSSSNGSDETEIKNISIDNSTNACSALVVASNHTIPVLNASRSSRFYTKYTLLIGNTSQYIGDDNSDNCTHTWCVYVRRPENQPTVSEIIQKVRFHLDASYKPNDVIEVIAEPFSLTKRGWGEFPITVEMFFKSKDKPVTFVHNLKLDKLKTGRYCLEIETAVEVALDINPKLRENIPQKVTKDCKPVFPCKESVNRELDDTNIKNIMKNSKLYKDMEPDLKPFNNLSIKQEFPKLDSYACSLDNYIYLNEPFLIHCIHRNSNSEYVIRVPQKHNCINLKYLKTQEKMTFLNRTKSEIEIDTKDHIKKLVLFDNIAIGDSKSILKRKCTELIQHSPDKVKVVESFNINNTINIKRKVSLLKPLDKLNDNQIMYRNNNKHEISAVQLTLLKNNNRVGTPITKKILPKHLKGQSSLLKCNNLNNKSIIKTGLTELNQSSECINSRNNSITLNTSILNENFNKNKQVPENPKIIIVRCGNSVLTKQNLTMPQTKTIRLSPERKLLGSKRNSHEKKIDITCMNMNSHLNNSIYSVFDKDVDDLKANLEQINVNHVIDYALKRIPLYVKPGFMQDSYFGVPTQQQFACYSLVKQITLEIKRSKYIHNFLKSLYTNLPDEWGYVSILKYSRDHGYLPEEHKYWSNICNNTREDSVVKTQKQVILECENNKDKKLAFVSYSEAENLISYFDHLLHSVPKAVHDTNEDIDIESLVSPSKCVKETSHFKNQMLPLLYGDKGICQFIINSAKSVGVSFQPEQLIAGVDHPSALEVMCSILQSFVSDVVRKSLGICRTQGSCIIELEHVFSSLLSRSEFDMLSNKNLGVS